MNTAIVNQSEAAGRTGGWDVALPWVTMRPRPGGDPWARSLDPDRFRAGPEVTGAGILLLDDTWASGASVQSAAVALKRSGARAVAVVVIGRHVPPPGPGQ